MYPQPDPVDPVDVAYERIFLELPIHMWRRYDFRAMSHAERKAAAMLVRAGVAELRVRCRLQIPGSKPELRAIAVVLGEYMDTSLRGQFLEAELRSAGRCLPGCRDSSLAILNAHKSALRLTVEGERAREQHRAGIPGALWSVPMTVPGQVLLEKMEIVPPIETPTTAQSPAQATASASVGDINVTVNVPPPEVVMLASTDVPPATGEAEAELRRPLFAVEHWSKLAIGIDGHWQYWAITPAPAAGEKFKKTDAYELKLPGKRWKALLKFLAESPSGNCCDTATLIRELGYLSQTSSVPREGRARRGSLERDLASNLPQQIAPSLNCLKDTVSDLARKLREQIEGPKGRDQKAALRFDGQAVRSGFVVGFLVPDDEGHLIFRHSSLESG